MAEVSVDTNTKGKNLAPYRRVSSGSELRVLVTPQLVGLASRMIVTTKGSLRKRLTVQLTGADAGCAL